MESRFTWLESKDTPDGRGRRRGDPGFDERTVTVPEKFYKQLSGAAAAASSKCLARGALQAAALHCMHALTCACRGAASQQQYWSIKRKYRDVILFFKVGACLGLAECALC